MRPRLGVLLLCVSACAPPAPFPETPAPAAGALVGKVDPFIGTGGEGYTFPGASAPWGMVSPSPHNRISTPLDYLQGEPFAPAGYLDGGERLLGFGLTHLSGVGCPDLGAPSVMATTGDVRTRPEGYGSRVAGERAWPGYYGADLEDFGVRAEATAGTRVAILRFRFPARGGDANLLIDAGTNLSWAGGQGEVRVVSPREIEGWSQTGDFCAAGNRQRIHFVARASRDAQATGTWVDGAVGDAAAAQGNAGAFLRYSTDHGEAIELAVGVSYVSIANARRNLDEELAGRGFEALRADTEAAWEAALSRVRVEGGGDEAQRIFYTALYHALLHPSVLSDVNGEHPRYRADGTAVATDHVRYHVFSLWDTYRTVHPLLTLLYPERQLDMLRSLAGMMAEGGRPPRWELAGRETDIMVGDPAAIVIADSYVKGLTAFDAAGAFAVLKAAALDTGPTPHRPGNASYRGLGYVPMEEAETVWGPVSTTLEYALADFNLARLAEALGQAADAATFTASSRAWANLFDAATGLLRPRHADGRFLEPFDPDALTGSRALQQRSGGPGYVEGTAWNYQFAVPHDVAHHAQLLGGEAAYVAALDALFEKGRYVMWNEPDIAFPFQLAAIDGAAPLAQRRVAEARAAWFTPRPDGIPGNDDVGTLSAWYVFAALGLAPACPGTDRYLLASPLFDAVELALPGGRFRIEAPHPSPAHVYVGAATLDGQPFAGASLGHAQLLAGGLLRLTLSDRAP